MEGGFSASSLYLLLLLKLFLILCFINHMWMMPKLSLSLVQFVRMKREEGLRRPRPARVCRAAAFPGKQGMCEALWGEEAGLCCSSSHWTKGRLANSLWKKQALCGHGQWGMARPKDIFSFPFKVLLGSPTLACCKKHWIESGEGVNGSSCLPRAFILNAGFAACSKFL